MAVRFVRFPANCLLFGPSASYNKVPDLHPIPSNVGLCSDFRYYLTTKVNGIDTEYLRTAGTGGLFYIKKFSETRNIYEVIGVSSSPIKITTFNYKGEIESDGESGFLFTDTGVKYGRVYSTAPDLSSGIAPAGETLISEWDPNVIAAATGFSSSSFYVYYQQYVVEQEGRRFECEYINPLFSSVNPTYVGAPNLNNNNFLCNILRFASYTSKVPISYIPIHSVLSGPNEAETGSEVTVDVSFPDGYKLKDTKQGSGISVYNDNGYIDYTYDEASGKLRFTMPE